MEFENKTLLVTGGTSGIGLGVAQRMSELGVRVGIIARNSDKGQDVVSRLPVVSFGDHLFVSADASDPYSFQQGIEQIQNSLGSLDFIFHSIGMDCPGTVEELGVLTWDKVIHTNLRSAYVLLHTVLPKMLERGQGIIIFNSSNKGLVAHIDDPIYCVSKAGLNMLMQSTALRVANRGVRINAVCPGPVRTSTLLDEAQSASHVPMNRVAEISEIVGLVLFLFSDSASYITGAAIPVDGGKSAGHDVGNMWINSIEPHDMEEP